jgi:hypothetical protein
MIVFLLPEAIQANLTRSIRRFWWGELGDKRKTHWIAWDKFTKPKGLGGLGFRDLKVFNQALLARQAWRLIDRPTSLCTRVLKARYYPNGCLLDTTFSANQSPTWRAIVHGLELVKKGVIWRIGSGEHTRIWRDPWIPRGASLRLIGKKRPCRLKRIAQLIDRDRMAWKADVLAEYFWPHDVDQIPNIRLPRVPVADFIAWHYEKTCVFTVKSAYRLAMEELWNSTRNGQSTSRNQGDRAIWKNYWRIPIPHKVLVFGWKVIHNGPRRAKETGK